MDYSTYASQYLNQRNPATGMYWTNEDIAKQTGTSVQDIQNYLGTAQQANLNSVMGTNNPPPLSSFQTGYVNQEPMTTQVVRPDGTTAAKPIGSSIIQRAAADAVPPVLGQNYMSESASPTAVTGGSTQPLTSLQFAPGIARDETPPETIRGVPGTTSTIVGSNPADLGGGPPSLNIPTTTTGAGYSTFPTELTRTSTTLPGADRNRTGSNPIINTIGGSRGGVPIPGGSGGTQPPTAPVVGNQAQSINPNAQWGLQMLLNTLGYTDAPMKMAADRYYNGSMPYLSQYFEANNPGQYLGLAGDALGTMVNSPYLNQLRDEQSAYGGMSANMLGGPGRPYGLTDFYSQLLQGGLPNQQAIQSIVPGALQQANYLQGGTGQGYGVNDLLKQVLSGGLPGQKNIEGLTNQFAQQAQTGALTPEYMQAMRQQILQPTQEAFQGAANRQGGGVASVPTFDEQGQTTSLGSGLFAELARRNERDFNNQMLTQAMQMQPQYAQIANQSFGNVAGAAQPYVGMAQQGGQQAIQNALAAFGIVPQSVAPFTGQMGGLTSDLMSQGLNRYNAGANTLANAAGQYGNLAQMLQSGALGLGSLQNQNYLGNLGVQGQLANTALSGDYRMQEMMNMAKLASAQGDKEAVGRIVAAIAQAFMGAGG